MLNDFSVKVKMYIPFGNANPSPPIGPILGQKGINIVKFCKEFNDYTNNSKIVKKGTPVPVTIIIYKDKKFSFKIQTPPCSFLIKEILNIKKGESQPGRNKNTYINKKEILNIANIKYKDLSASDIYYACSTVLGTARSMGILLNEKN